jgi:hypothetical protein
MQRLVDFFPISGATAACAAIALAVAFGCGSSGKNGFDANGDNGGDGPGGAGANGDGGPGFGNGDSGPTSSPDLHCMGLVDGKQSSAGCDYYAVVPDVVSDGAGGCFAAFITNTYTDPVSIQVDFGGQTLDPTKFAYIPTGAGGNVTYTPLGNAQIPPGQVAILFLNRMPGALPMFGLNIDCPKGVTPAITTKDAATHGTNLGSAFHIVTSAAVAAYDIYPFGGGQSAMTSATLLLPTTSWDTNYIAIDAYRTGPVDQPFVQIVGQQDGTNVTVNPSAAIAGNGGSIAATAKGTPHTYIVNKGQVLQFTQDASLSGSIIQSDIPVGVWGGKTALAITSCCDETSHQQIPPIRALGNEYVGVRYRNRYDAIEEAPPWRIVGAVPGTVLTYEPSMPAGAPPTLTTGTVAEFNATGPFVVKSQDAQHPFYMSAHMTGAAQYDPSQMDMTSSATPDGRGDAEFVNVVPPGEFMTSYVFFTDPTYSETNLVLVRSKVNGAFADVTLDCGGKLSGWLPVGSSGDYEYTRIDLVRHNFESQNGCNNGRHEINSPNPFGLTVWGWGSAETGDQLKGFNTQYVSYAYPGGASVKPINTVVVPAGIK